MRQKSRFQIARRFLIFWTLFIGIGAAQTATGYAAWVFGKQKAFYVALTNSPNIGTNEK